MHPDPKHRHEEEGDLGEAPRWSIFSGWWFRGLLMVIALVVVAVIALPYLLDWWTPPAIPFDRAQLPPPLPSPHGQQVELAAKATAKSEAKVAEPVRERPKTAASPVGRYWIQVGAFKDQANAATLAARLATESYPTRHLALARPGRRTHELFVADASEDEVNGKLRSIRRLRSAERLHRVWVGRYPDRQHAQAVQKDLASKGFPGFIVNGTGQ